MKEAKDLRQSVVDSRPELQDIQDESLREKVIEAWVRARFVPSRVYVLLVTWTPPV